MNTYLIFIFLFLLGQVCSTNTFGTTKMNASNLFKNTNRNNGNPNIPKPLKPCNTNPYRRVPDLPFRQPTDDMMLQRVREHITFYAEQSMKKTNIQQKKILNGELPPGSTDEMVAAAGKVHSDKSKWNEIMLYPTEVWSFCIYPQYELNVMKWCDQTYAIKSPDKLKDCKYNYCTVCCDQLKFIYKAQAMNRESRFGEYIMLDGELGFEKIQKIVTFDEVNKCRKRCRETYPVTLPNILPPPPRDEKLGTSPQSPAQSCADIKKWGGENAKSGTYWLQFNGTKGKAMVYCDLDTDRGGWTLFFNYNHLPGQEITIDSSKIPMNLNSNSHINLKDLGYDEKDILEIRFYCTEKTSKKNYWHFKVTNPEVVNLALSGDQTLLKHDSFSKSYEELKFPGRTIGWYKAIDTSTISALDLIGSNRKGNFWDTPFGSTGLNRFWTVKGNLQYGGRYECGTRHKDGVSKEITSLVNTHHTVWFRGDPPSEEDARGRYTVRNNRLQIQK